MPLQPATNNGSLVFVASNVTLDVQDQSQYFDYDISRPLNAHNINICCDLNSIIGSRAPKPLRLPYTNSMLVSGDETKVYIDIWDSLSGNDTDAVARNQLRTQLFDHSQIENSASNSGAAVLIKLRTSSTTVSGMEGFYMNKTQLSVHDSNISVFEDLVSGGIYTTSGVDWTVTGNQTIFNSVTGNSVLGLITRKFVPDALDTRDEVNVPEGTAIATTELMNDYLTSTKTVDCPSGNVYEEFGVPGRLYSQDTVLGQLDEALISFFEAVNYIPEIPTTAQVTNASEELFLRSWMTRDNSNVAVKKFQIDKDRVRNLLSKATSLEYQTDTTSGTAEDLIRCVFDQDQMKSIAMLIQQSGRYEEFDPSTKSMVLPRVYTHGTNVSSEVSTAGGEITQAEYVTKAKAITPSFRHGEGIAVIVPIKANVPKAGATGGTEVQTGYFLVRVFQSYFTQDGTNVAARTGGIDSNAA